MDVLLLPISGAYDIPGAQLAVGGIPVWDRSALVTARDLAGPMVDALGDRPVVVLRGHGLMSVADGPPETAVAARSSRPHGRTLARTTLRVRSAGGTPTPISDEDLAALLGRRRRAERPHALRLGRSCAVVVVAVGDDDQAEPHLGYQHGSCHS